MRKSEGITPQITNGWENYVFAKNPLQYFLKFIYSEKVTNVCEICTVDLTIIGQIYGGDFAKFCGLLRIYELYLPLQILPSQTFLSKIY